MERKVGRRSESVVLMEMGMKAVCPDSWAASQTKWTDDRNIGARGRFRRCLGIPVVKANKVWTL